MDMQKENSELQNLINEMHDVTGTWSVADMVAHVWQAAKASAVPEGYCVVPKEPTAKMIDATWDYDDEIQNMSHNSRNEFIYKAMIEAAQEVS